MQHGVKRVREQSVDASILASRKAKEERQIADYNAVRNAVLDLNTRREYGQQHLDLSAQLIGLNPEMPTAWAFRRRVLLASMKDLPAKDTQDMLAADLRLTLQGLRSNPKIYSVWEHRKWVLANMPDPAWAQELALVDKFLQVDSRNFHGWAYRRHILACAPGCSSWQAEFDFTTAKISSSFSNFSAWQYRANLLETELPNWHGQDLLDRLDKEYELVRQALYTDPGDQSGWIYHRLLSSYYPTQDVERLLLREIQSIEELASLDEVGGGIFCSRLAAIARLCRPSILVDQNDTSIYRAPCINLLLHATTRLHGSTKRQQGSECVRAKIKLNPCLPFVFLSSKHAQILRELVRQSDNKICADCKKNDARWASVNLGVFMCIRCSGIHRSLGVHITRIKSVDLDTWLPEQIVVVQRWGNKRANKYFEAHLKPGHQPPDHKMESFIRSKYEGKKWAMDGPVPEPETLDDEQAVESVSVPVENAKSRPQQRAGTAVDLLSAPSASSAPVSTDIAPPSSARSSQPVQAASRPSAGGGLFDLDFAAPTSNASAPKPSATSSKADILSLFASAPPPVSQAQASQSKPQAAFDAFDFGSMPTQSKPAPALPTSFANLNLGNDPWSASATAPNTQNTHARQPSQPTNRSAFANDSFGSQDVWASTSSGNSQKGAFDDFGDFSTNKQSTTAAFQSTNTFDDIWK